MIDIWCNRIIRLCFFLLFSLVPIILTPWNYELFEFNKMMATYALTAVIMTAWIVKMISLREIRIARTPLDIPLLLFVLSQFISALYSIDPHVSWFGYYSRFNGGMWSIVSYVLLYYAFVTNFISFSSIEEISVYSKYQKSNIKDTHEKSNRAIQHFNSITILLKVALITAAVISFYGVLERLGIDKNLWVQDVQNRVFSTLGQPNWLAAYLVGLYPVALAFALQAKINGKEGRRLGFLFWTAVSVLFFIVLIFTRSRSGLGGFAAVSLVFWVCSWLMFKKVRQNIRNIFIGLHLVYFVFLFFNGSYVAKYDQYLTWPGLRSRFQAQKEQEAVPQQATDTLLVTGGTESGEIRKYVWQAAVNAWRSSTKTMLIGTGTETFVFAFYQFKPQEHNLTSEWDFLYNKAHNEYLNYLATTGVFGLGSYLLFLSAFVIWFVKTQSASWRTELKAQDIWILNLALFAGWTSILVTNFFGFSVVVTQLFLFLIPAICFVLLREPTTIQYRRIALPHKPGAAKLVIGFTGVFGFLLVLRLATFWVADISYATGYRLARSGSYERSKEFLARAIALSPNEPLYHDEMSTTLAALTTAAIEEREDATRAAELAQHSMRESDRTLAISPNNVNYWKTRTKIFYSFSSFNPDLNKAAIDALKQAQSLYPTDPKIDYNLAILYGHEGDNSLAIDYLTQAITLKPNYRDAYYALFVFYTDTKQLAPAREILTKYLEDVDPNDRDFQDRLNQL